LTAALRDARQCPLSHHKRLSIVFGRKRDGFGAPLTYTPTLKIGQEVMLRRLAAPCCIGLILGWIVATGCNLALAQGTFPSKPVKFLIPYPGGGSNDVLARIVGDKLQAKWGQPVIIENRTGGSGNIGAAAEHDWDQVGARALSRRDPGVQ
jgi:hypothetical protein